MKTKQDVADYISNLIDRSGKTQEQIVREMDVPSSNLLSMIRTGRTKFPLARIPAFARSVGSDPKALFALALEAYEPELYDLFATIAPGMLISTKELKVIRALRVAARTGMLS